MPPSKSIFRQPGAKHFQLVHRSQRDPLINDPDASDRVLKPFERENTKKGKTRADLENDLPRSELSGGRENVGEASLYGVYFDDTEYDYMRHLRPVGVQEDGVESVLIEAPSSSAKKTKNQRKNGIELLDLPEGVLASTSELPRTYESQQAVPASISGFQPDMDAHLRQVLEALEDDAFVDDDLEDNFFDELVADGERGSDEEVDFDFTDEAFEEGKTNSEPHDEDREVSWEKKFADFKKSQKANAGSDDGYDSEGGDTVGTLPAISVIGGKGKKRRKGSSEASGYSMSSSSMFRNEALQTLDERFDQMIMKQYNEDEDEDDEDENGSNDGDSDEAPELITTRDDFDSMVNTFLNDFEILGRKMKPRLEGDSGVEKLDILRRAMGQDERVRVMNGEDEVEFDEEALDAHLFPDNGDKKDRWDCETILTTYTNLENHPRLIRARDLKPGPQIVLDRKTGLPSVLKPSEKATLPTKTKKVNFGSASEDTDESEGEGVQARGQAIGRARDESKEEKKARKAAVKAEKQVRRAEKKATKEQFGAEVKDQKKRIGNKELRLKKL